MTILTTAPAEAAPAEAAVARIGLDATSVSRWRQRLRRSPALPGITFTAGERNWAEQLADDPAQRYAMVWAAKESVVKAAARGFDGLSWRDVDIDPLRGRAALPGCRTRWRVRCTHRCSRVVAVAWDPGAPVEVAAAGRLVGASWRYADLGRGSRARRTHAAAVLGRRAGGALGSRGIRGAVAQRRRRARCRVPDPWGRPARRGRAPTSRGPRNYSDLLTVRQEIHLVR